MHKYGLIFHSFQWLIVLLCCVVIIAIGDNYSKAFGCLEDEKIGLLKLKDYINHQNKSAPSTWGAEQVVKDDCCKWEGITCGDDVFSKRIVNLSLNILYIKNFTNDEWFLDASLFQPFEELQNLTVHDFSFRLQGFKGRLRLTKLQVLDLNSNFAISHVLLTGEIPSLKFLDLSYNRMSHGFQELINLSSLELLNLGENYIEGQIPSSIRALTSLKKLGLARNRMNGSLPEGLCSLTYLEELDLSHNYFEGVLPTCLSGLTSLRFLDLSGNKFEGVIPTYVSNLTSLQFLDLSGNQFSGNIPSTIFSGLKSLQYVSLSHNHFDCLFSFNSLENNSSKIEVFKLKNYNPMLKVETENSKWKPQLKIFILSNCILNEPSSGIIPSFLLTQYDLRVVDLSNNGMNGELPTWLLTNNSRLEGLTLRNNSFTGPLQFGSYNNAHMYWFDISMNRVTGEIPKFLGSILPNLNYLDMSTNAIEGRIPSSMLQLIKLDLSNNHIYGEIPADLFYRCKRLDFLKLSNNNLTTFLPMKPPRLPLTSLVVLDISNNSFTGRFPDMITEVSSLKTLVMSKNHFEGKLPAAFCNLKNLEILDLSWNNFVDTLPPCTHLPNLSHLYLQVNKFHGLFPNFLSKSSSLSLLDVSNNKFSGLIPAWISSLRDLTFLLLSRNIFHGSIPSQLCHMENLNIIDLSANNFTGSIPPCLFHIPIGKFKVVNPFGQDLEGISLAYDENDYTNKIATIHRYSFDIWIQFWLEVTEQVQFITKSMPRSYLFNQDTDIQYFISGIDLSFNKLTGPIPVDIENWENVLSLNLSYNYLNGSIPWTLSRLKILESLDLSHNMLSGKIPYEMSKLTFLGVFSVAYNNLSGPTPTTSNQFGTFDSGSYEGNPLLCGPPLAKSCRPTKIMPNAKPFTEEPEENDSSFKIQFLWSFIGSFSVSCIGAFVYLYFGSNVPQIVLQWIGVEKKTPRRRTVELPWNRNIL